MIRAIGVGIPARNEAATIAETIHSVVVAARHRAVRGIPVHVVVAADSCTDATEAVVRRWADAPARIPVAVKAGAWRTAGAARAAAVDAALVRCIAGRGRRATQPSDVWLATTDADTAVDQDWLAAQLAWAATGAAAVAGLVRVRWTAETEHLAPAHDQTVDLAGRTVGHGHVHGANLGVRGDWWVHVDGCGDGADGEDHELWRRLRRAGAPAVQVDDVWVTTSSRLVSRVPAGFSGHLRELDRRA